MKEIVIVSHCILNDASKVKSLVALTEEEKDKELLMSLVRWKNIQLIQLPCPEFIIYGAKRWGHVALKSLGTSIFAATFMVKIGNNLIDKIGTCLIAYEVIQKLPRNLKYKLSNKNISEGTIAG